MQLTHSSLRQLVVNQQKLPEYRFERMKTRNPTPPETKPILK